MVTHITQLQKCALRHLNCLAPELREGGYHTWAWETASCLKTAWKKAAGCRICALPLQASWMVFRVFNSFFFLKICGYQFQGSLHMCLFLSGGFQVKAATWIHFREVLPFFPNQYCQTEKKSITQHHSVVSRLDFICSISTHAPPSLPSLFIDWTLFIGFQECLPNSVFTK